MMLNILATNNKILYTIRNTKLLPYLPSTLQKLIILESKEFENSKLCTKIFGKNEKGR